MFTNFEYEAEIQKLLEVLESLPEVRFTFDLRWGRSFRLDNLLILTEEPTNGRYSAVIRDICMITFMESGIVCFTDYYNQCKDADPNQFPESWYRIGSENSFKLHNLMQKLLRYEVDRVAKGKKSKRKVSRPDPKPVIESALESLKSPPR